jgi:hypothetical protein
MPEPVPQHDADGELEGYTWEQPDGSIAAYDADGDLLGVSYGSEWYDRSELEDADDGAGEGYEHDGEAELQQRLAELEQRAGEPVYLPVPIAVEPDREQQTADLFQQAQHWERVHGRPMTLREKRAIGEALSEAQVAGEERPDLQAAADRLAAEHRGLADIDSGSTHEQRRKRQEVWTELLADRQRYADAEAGADDLTNPEPPPSQGVYDLDSRSERHAYLADRLRGAASPDDTFSGSDYAEDAGLG